MSVIDLLNVIVDALEALYELTASETMLIKTIRSMRTVKTSKEFDVQVKLARFYFNRAFQEAGEDHLVILSQMNEVLTDLEEGNF